MSEAPTLGGVDGYPLEEGPGGRERERERERGGGGGGEKRKKS